MSRLLVPLCVATALAAQGAPQAAGAAESRRPGIDAVQVLDFGVHDAGNLRVLVANWGQIGSRPGASSLGSEQPSLEWPAGSGVEYLWAAGLWIGALADIEPHVTTTAFVVEVRPGTLDSDRMYATHEGAAGGLRAPSPQADDDGDGRTDEDPLNGRDDDLDGRVDEDFRAISDQMFYGEYGDTDPAIQIAVPSHVPLGVHVGQGTYAWADPRIDDLLGIEYQVTNTGDHRLDTAYFGLFADCDIGRRTNPSAPSDDRAGFWEGFVHTDLGGPSRTVKVSIGYMFDADGEDGEPTGWVGLVFLGAADSDGSPLLGVRLRNFRMITGTASYSSGGDPNNDTERMQVLEGTDPMPLPAPDPQTGLRPPLLSSRSGDWRMLLSAGPVSALDPGESVRVAFAFVLGADFGEMVSNAARALILYENGWRTEGPTPVAIQDLEGSAAEGEVRLAWRLSPEALGTARQVRVQRGPAAAGPFGDQATLAPAASMSWVDPQPDPLGPVWYRIEVDAAGLGVWSSPPLEIDAGSPARPGLEPPVARADGGTEIRYRIAAAGPADLAVFDVHGRRVATLVQGRALPGSYLRVWDGCGARGTAVARGVYFVRLAAGDAVLTRKLVRTRQ